MTSAAELDHLRAVITAAITQLQPEDSALLTLFYAEGLTASEVASVLQQSESTVLAHRADVLNRIRAHLMRASVL